MQRKDSLQKRFTSPHKTGETGQAIVLIAVAALVLVAIMGLAIDGGRLLFLKRETQNASDAAAIAAARALCLDRADWKEAGEAAAERNGFLDGDNGDIVEIVSPPTKAGVEIAPECGGCYVEVTVGGEIPASFIGIVYDGPLATTSYAIGACNPNQFSLLDDDEPDMRALFGLSPDCETTVTGSSVEIVGGAHANGDIKINPSQGGGIIVGPTSYAGEAHNSLDKIKFCPPDEGCPDGYGGGGGGYTTPAGLCAPSCFTDPDGGDDGGSGGSGDCEPGSFPAENPYKVCEQLEDPLGYELSDFAPGSDFANAAAADPDGGYYDFTASGYACSKQGTKSFIDDHTTGGVLDTGLYYFGNCEIQLNQFSNKSGTITWVTGGPIKVSGGTNDLHAYTDGLLMFSDAGGDTCVGRAIELPGSSNTLEGNLYGPHGEVKFSNSGGYLKGCLIARRPNFSGSDTEVICEPGIAATGGDPGVWLSE